MIIAAASDVGRVRKVNEDSYFVSDIIDENVVAVVADGMGGHKGGKVASSTVAECIQSAAYENDFFSRSVVELKEIIRETVARANEEVYNRSNSEEALCGMGTTLVMCVASQDRTVCANIGDSRMYLLSDSILTQITKDHSLVQNLIDKGQITNQEALIHPNRNVITKAVGTDKCVEPDFFECNAKKGDFLILCSDGLTNMVSEDDIYYIVKHTSSPDEACSKLVEMANNAGGSDNITVIIIRL